MLGVIVVLMGIGWFLKPKGDGGEALRAKLEQEFADLGKDARDEWLVVAVWETTEDSGQDLAGELMAANGAFLKDRPELSGRRSSSGGGGTYKAGILGMPARQHFSGNFGQGFRAKANGAEAAEALRKAFEEVLEKRSTGTVWLVEARYVEP